MNTIYKPKIAPSYQKMYEQALDIHSANHPVQKEIDKCLKTITFSATITEDKQTLSVLKNIPGGVVAFLCTLKANGIVISEGRSVSVIDGVNNKYVSKTIQFSKNAALLDAVAKSTKYLEVINLDTVFPKNSGIALDKEYQVKKVENTDSITHKQKKYLIQLIHQNCTDEKECESLINQLDEMSSQEASEQIKSFIG